LRILLINPPYAASEPPRVPMGLLYVGGALEEAGHDVKVLDLLVSRFDRDAVLEALEDFDPALVGTTSVTMNWPEASRILRWVKETAPWIATVAGGPHATFTWEDIGSLEPWVDYVVLREGEKTAVELARAVEMGAPAENTPGLAWRQNGVMKAGPNREFEPDLDSLPKPARHLFPLSRYRLMGVEGGLTTGRGCPHRCMFCVGPKMVGRKARLRSPTAVVDEMEELLELGFKHIAFSDDHFGMNRSHAIAVCDEIISRNMDIELSIFIRADAAEPVLLEKMRRAGCSKILYGAESGVQEIVDRIRKKTDLEMLRRKVKLALEMDFQVQVTFILGLPGETPETVQQTFEYARSLGTFFGMHVLAPLPGSEIFERASELGMRILHRDWSLYDANHVVTETEGLTAGELEKIVGEIEGLFTKVEAMEAAAWRRGELVGESLDRFESRRCKSFYWEMLRNGFFDGPDCRIEVAGCEAPLDALIKKAANRAETDEREAGKWIRSALDSGDLMMVEEGTEVRLTFEETTYPSTRPTVATGEPAV